MLCGNYILSNRSEWTFYFLSSVQFNFTISENDDFKDETMKKKKLAKVEFHFENVECGTIQSDIIEDMQFDDLHEDSIKDLKMEI